MMQVSVSELKTFIEAALDERLFARWHLQLLLLFISAVLGGLIAWFGSYLRVKAQNFATAQDLGKLTQQVEAATRITEEIRSQMSGELWERQGRFTLKRDLYIRMLDALSEAAQAFRLLILFEERKTNKTTKDTSEHDRLRERVSAAMDQVRHAWAIAELVVKPQTIAVLREFGAKWVEARTQEVDQLSIYYDLREAVLSAMSALTTAAREDLRLEPLGGSVP